MKFTNTKPFIGITCFAVGALAMYSVQYFMLKPKYMLREPLTSAKGMGPLFGRCFNDDFFDRSGDPFKEIRRMREGMLKQFNQDEGGGLFDSWYQKRFGGGRAGDITQREDDHYIYYDVSVQGLKPEKVNVKVENGQLSIYGQVEKKSDEAGSSSYFSSSFHRSFPVPPNVESAKLQIEQKENMLIVKLPKLEGKAT